MGIQNTLLGFGDVEQELGVIPRAATSQAPAPTRAGVPTKGTRADAARTRGVAASSAARKAGIRAAASTRVVPMSRSSTSTTR